MTELPPRQKPLTIREVARAAGVSTALVSIVFRGAPGASEATRARVFAVAGQLGYRANRTASLMKLRRTKHLGVTMNVRSAFQGRAGRGNSRLRRRSSGYQIVLSLDHRCTRREPCHRDTAGLPLRIRDHARLPAARSAAARAGSRAAAGPGGTPGGESRQHRRGAIRRSPRPSAGRKAISPGLATARSSTSMAASSPSPPSDGRVTGPRCGRYGLGEHVRVVTGGDYEADGHRAAAELLRGRAAAYRRVRVQRPLRPGRHRRARPRRDSGYPAIARSPVTTTPRGAADRHRPDLGQPGSGDASASQRSAPRSTASKDASQAPPTRSWNPAWSFVAAALRRAVSCHTGHSSITLVRRRRRVSHRLNSPARLPRAAIGHHIHPVPCQNSRRASAWASILSTHALPPRLSAHDPVARLAGAARAGRHIERRGDLGAAARGRGAPPSGHPPETGLGRPRRDRCARPTAAQAPSAAPDRDTRHPDRLAPANRQ